MGLLRLIIYVISFTGASQIYPDMWYNFLLMAIQVSSQLNMLGYKAVHHCHHSSWLQNQNLIGIYKEQNNVCFVLWIIHDCIFWSSAPLEARWAHFPLFILGSLKYIGIRSTSIKYISWWAIIILFCFAFQMLLSFLYFTSILTVARSPSTPPAPKPTIHTNGSIPQVPSVLRLRRHSLNSLMSRQSLSERTIHMNGDGEWMLHTSKSIKMDINC